MPPDPESLRPLLEAARRRSPGERESFLDSACGTDTELRKQVGEYLERYDVETSGGMQPSSVVTRPVSDIDATVVVPSTAALKRESEKQQPLQQCGEFADGRYRMGEEIARGGMGAVNRATDLILEREVAVKRVLGSPGDLSEMAERFRHEAKVTARLQHPGVPPVHELGEMPGGRPYLVMKLIGGRTLAELLGERKSPKAQLSRWINVFEVVAQTIGYAHSQQVIHRDLKPANVMVGDFGEVQVMDWGLAKGVGEEECALPVEPKGDDLGDDGSTWLTSPGSVLGTLFYMSPEQARGDEDLDARTDVFALGAILCEILTGRPPYSGKSRSELVEKVSGAELADAYEALERSGADAELIAIARECLAAQRDDRPKNGEEVAERIAHYRTTVEQRLREVEADRARVETMAAERRKRHKIRLALVASVALLVLSGSGFAWWWERAEKINSLKEAEYETKLAREESERVRVEAEIKQRETQNRLATEGLLLRVAETLRENEAAQSEALLAEAGARLEEGGAEELRERFDELAGEFEMLKKLQVLDEEGWFSSDLGTQQETLLATSFKIAFRSIDIIPGETPMEKIVEKVNGAEIETQLLGALERWFLTNGDAEVRKILAAVDPDPLRNQVRDKSYPEVWNSFKERGELMPPQPSWFATAYGRSAGGLHESWRRALLMGSFERYPDDFSLVMTLGLLGDDTDPNVGAKRASWCRAAVALRPLSGAAWNNLGVALAKMGEDAEAEAAFRRSIELKPEIPHAYKNLAGILWRNGNQEAAIKLHRKAVQLRPESAPAWATLAVELVEAKKFDEAEEALERYFALAPGSARGYATKSMILSARRDQKGAIDAAEQSVELDPKLPDARLIYGKVLCENKKWGEAVKQFQQATDLAPNDPRPWVGLGGSLQEVGNLQEAKDAFRRAAELSPRDAATRVKLGEVMLAQKDYQGAANALEEGVRLGAGGPELYHTLAGLLEDQQRYDEGVAVIDKLIENHSRNKRNLARAYQMKARMLEKMGDAEGENEAKHMADELDAESRKERNGEGEQEGSSDGDGENEQSGESGGL